MRFQRPRRSDLPVCAELLEERFLYGDSEVSDLVRFWAESLSEGIACASMVTDEGFTGPLAFGITGFVDDAFGERIQRYDRAAVGREIFDAWRSGRSPLLGDAQIARANAGDGVNCVVLGSGWTHVDLATRFTASAKLIEGFMDVHLGMFFRTFAHEIFGEPPFPPEALALQLVPSLDERAAAFRRTPLLMRLHRDRWAGENFTSGQMFMRPPTPRFFFDARARAVLRLALDGLADEEIAREIGISTNGLKKRWQQIFERVRDSSALLDGAQPSDFGKRGAELRRVVVAYVRANREELHAYGPDRKEATTPGAKMPQRSSPA